MEPCPSGSMLFGLYRTIWSDLLLFHFELNLNFHFYFVTTQNMYMSEYKLDSMMDVIDCRLRCNIKAKLIIILVPNY